MSQNCGWVWLKFRSILFYYYLKKKNNKETIKEVVMHPQEYLKVKKLMEHPLKRSMQIYSVYIIAAIPQYFYYTVLPSLPIPGNPYIRLLKWNIIWSLAYFSVYFLLVLIYTKLLAMCHDQQNKRRYEWCIKFLHKNILCDLFTLSFKSYNPIILGLLFSFSELIYAKLSFKTIIPWIDDAVVLFFIGISVYIFSGILFYSLKVANSLRQHLEKSEENQTIYTLLKIYKRKDILNIGNIICISVLILSLISALIIIPSCLDVFRYANQSLGYFFIFFLIILPPLVFFCPMVKFHITLNKAKRSALEQLDTELLEYYKMVINKTASFERQRVADLKSLRSEISSIQTLPIDFNISFGLVFSSILPLISFVSIVYNEIIRFLVL